MAAAASDSEGVEIEDGTPRVTPAVGGAATAGRPTRSAASRGSSKLRGNSSALASFFSSEDEESESATDGDDDDEEDGDTEYTQTRGSDDDDDDDSEYDSDLNGGAGAGRGSTRGRGSRGGAVISRHRSRSPPGGISDGGYTSGFTTGDESGEDLFDGDLDPMSLLEELEQQGAAPVGTAGGGGTGAYGGGTSASALQPFELIRQRRWAQRKHGGLRRGGDSDDVDDGDDGTAAAMEREETGPEGDDVEMEDAGPSRGGGRGRGRGGRGRGRGRGGRTPSAAASGGRGRGRPAQERRRSSAASDVFGADVDDILDDPLAERMGIIEPGSRRRGRGRGRGRGRSRARRRSRPKRGLPEEVVAKLGQANVMYALQDYQPAIELLTQVIKEYPNVSDPYHTLGLLHEANGQPRKALDFFMIAAHLSPKDVALWKRLASMSTELGFYRQAVYCLSKAINRNRSDLDAIWDRAVLYAQVKKNLNPQQMVFAASGRRNGQGLGAIFRGNCLKLFRASPLELRGKNVYGKRAEWNAGVICRKMSYYSLETVHARTFVEVHELAVGRQRPGDPEVPVMKARLYHQAGAPLKAIAVLEAHLRDYPSHVDLTHINILAELYMERGGYVEARALIQRAVPVLCPDQALPLDLAVKSGLCLAHTGQWEEADEVLGELLREPVEQFGDLYISVGSALAGLGQYDKALHYLNPLLEHPDFNDLGLWTQLLKCHTALGEVGEGLELYREQMQAMEQSDPRRPRGGSGNEAQPAVPPNEPSGQVGCTEVRYVSLIQPAVESSLSALAADLARVNDPSLEPSLKRAILRRRMFARKGKRKGEGAAETGSVFKGATRRDRRSARTREYDRKAAEVLGLPYDDIDADDVGGTGGGSGLDGSGTDGTDGGGGATGSDSDFSGGEGRRRRGHGGGGGAPRFPRGGLVGPSVLSDPAQAQVLLQVTRALTAMGRSEDARALLDRAIALVISGGGGAAAAAAADGGGSGSIGIGSLMVKRAGGPWFERAVIDRLKLGQLELASTATEAGADAAAGGGGGGSGGGWGLLDSSQLAALKSLTNRWPYSIGLWNLYCSAHAQGHVYLLARQFREAASEYFHAYRFVPEEPLLLLCLGVTLLSEAMASAAAMAPGAARGGGGGGGGAASQQLPAHRHGRSGGGGGGSGALRDRNRGVLAGFAFLQMYQKTRGGQLSQEVSYNMGRAAHQLGLLHLAHHYYELALAAPPAAAKAGWQSTLGGGGAAAAAAAAGFGSGAAATATHGSGERWDLRRDVAHNLVQLYLSSGATELAREVMAKYLVF
ncbi:hypothetical protein VOLCADRAFT_90359 [Volvox carteri f. nagariensis]|uniref:Uncharacterized protein n=1 Tax=Volvox carteri f. nagariensis TaxID=3068 RepID=D8TU59_VOLCA|nr:uncharacterized protein VOLCADRAFT_90359 [Volvox carteri f. nagariensis]EFJ49086.1 hypothetical protein VOLCADRAFT_90359 [Volvox carteri f. nagariensis]|eukprot:XP_002949983.1 hypothetical protein VOLCADRAFT_90359 [Volvox carteri f. nagariensis]